MAEIEHFNPTGTDRLSYSPSNPWDMSTPLGEEQFSREMDALHQFDPHAETSSKSLWIEVTYYGIMFIIFSVFFTYVL